MIISTSLLYSVALAVTSLIFTATPTFAAHLTESDFQSSIAKGLWLVEFYSPYCPHCKRFAPTWEKVAEEKAPLGAISGFTMAQVNCIAQGDLCNANKVTGYPQVMLFQDGKKLREYNGDRTHDDLSKFVDEAVAEFTKSTTETAPSSGTETPHLNTDGSVLVLSPDTFEKTLAEGPAFVKFYAPWCGHCKKLAPVWVELAKKAQGRATIAEVDCDRFGGLCKSQGVDGYPMLFFFNAGQKVDFRGGRKIDALEQFVLRAVSPGVQQIDAKEADNALKTEPVFFLALYTYSTQEYLASIEEASKSLLGSPPVYKSRDPELFKKFDIDPAQGPVLLVIKDHDRQPFAQFPLTAVSTTPLISTFFQHHRTPVLQQLTSENFADVMKHPAKPLVVLTAFDMEKMPKTELSESIEKLSDIAKRWQRQAVRLTDTRPTIFVYMDGERWSKWLKSMYGIRKERLPATVIVDHHRLLYYDHDSGKAPFRLEHDSIFGAVESAYLGFLTPKHSENFIERTVRSLNDRLEYIGSSAVAHPFVSVGVVVGFLAGALWVVRRLVEDDLPTGSYQSTHTWKPSNRMD
ncbi:thioredoxin [Ceratobasidium sp. AG-Ba]|nr:thioredoxin [Ceratobasidium sp. AG-Ba]